MKRNGHNIVQIKTTLRGLFRHWLMFTRPMNKLTDSEINLISLLLYKRFVLKASIKDDEYINRILFSTESRKDIIKELGITTQYYNNMLTRLRKKGVLGDSKIKKQYIPNVKENSDQYSLIFNFKYDSL